MILIDTGDRIAAKAAQMARPEVLAAYPITPQTVIVEKTAEYVATGELDAEYICVESEHSAMSAVIGAQAAGVRTFTATSSHGLALMHEMLHWAALARLPIVMANVNRALAPGWSIWADETDSVAQRDTGWIQFYCSSNQEIFDTIIQAYKLAESREVQLPVMVNFDAFVLSHTSMPVEIPEQRDIDEFLPKFKPFWKLDTANPFAHGSILPPDKYMEFRYIVQRAHEAAKELIPAIAEEWRDRFGTYHGGLIEEVGCDDAEFIIVAVGALGAEARVSVRNLRDQGYRVGLARMRVFRPFPEEELRRIGENRTLIVVDRNISTGSGGAVFTEARAALHGAPGSRVYGFVAGLGGKDVTYQDLEDMAKKVIRQEASEVEWWEWNETGGM
jgi:pyruvate/2-oxoacid:ferredoxin oxidoreductase alpha subunit